MSSEKHAPGTGEFAVCGLAFDAHDSGHVDEPVVFAQPGQRVTCPACLQVIEYVRLNFRGCRYVPAA